MLLCSLLHVRLQQPYELDMIIALILFMNKLRIRILYNMPNFTI